MRLLMTPTAYGLESSLMVTRLVRLKAGTTNSSVLGMRTPPSRSVPNRPLLFLEMIEVVISLL